MFALSCENYRGHLNVLIERRDQWPLVEFADRGRKHFSANEACMRKLVQYSEDLPEFPEFLGPPVLTGSLEGLPGFP